MNFENIKLVAIDLDETLLRQDKTISDRTINILNSLAVDGIQVVPITGRPFTGLPEQLLSIDKINYAVCSNGAKIIDMHTGEKLFSNVISNKNAKIIIDLLKENNLRFEVFCDNTGYIEKEEYDLYIKEFSGTPFGNYVLSTRTVVNSQRAIFDDETKCADDFFIICKSEDEREKLAKQFDDISEIQLCRFENRFIEITNINADKGNGLKTICNYLNIDLKNTIAFGDDANDIKLLRTAGISVAMGNAIDKIKETADIVTLSNNDDGVAHILEQIKV